MRFSDTGYYIERYIKCDNCGVLIYGDGIADRHEQAGDMIFCSDWCRAWKAQRLEGADHPRLHFAEKGT